MMPECRRNAIIPVMKNFIIMANDMNFTHSLFAGALIAIARTGHMIPWDNDIDIIIPVKVMEKIRSNPFHVAKYSLERYLPTCSNISCKITVSGGEIREWGPTGFLHLVAGDIPWNVVPCDLTIGDADPFRIYCPEGKAFISQIAKYDDQYNRSLYNMSESIEAARNVVRVPTFDHFKHIADTLNNMIGFNILNRNGLLSACTALGMPGYHLYSTSRFDSIIYGDLNAYLSIWGKALDRY